MKLTEAQRAELKMKFEGHCAYCGDPLGEKWHADHLEAVVRDLTTGKPEKPENDVIENLMPACSACNWNSGEFDLRSYYDRVNTEQNWTLRPILERIFPVIFKSLFGVIPTGFNFVFYPLWQLDVKTRSEVEKNNTERDIKYLEKGIITEAMIAKQLQQDGTYDFLDDDHIKALEGLAGQIDDNTNQP